MNNLAVYFRYAASGLPAVETHTLSLQPPERWPCWTDIEQGEWVLSQILVAIDKANRGVRPPRLEFGYDLDVEKDLPC